MRFSAVCTTFLVLVFAVYSSQAATRAQVVAAMEAAEASRLDSDTAFGEARYIDAGDYHNEAWFMYYDADPDGGVLPVAALAALEAGDDDLEEGDSHLFPGIVFDADAQVLFADGEDLLSQGDGEIDFTEQAALYDGAIAKFNAAAADWSDAEDEFAFAKQPYDDAITNYLAAELFIEGV